jgi:hypothetical protein
MSYVVYQPVEGNAVYVSETHPDSDFHWTCERDKARIFKTFKEAHQFRSKNDLFKAMIWEGPKTAKVSAGVY